MPSTLQLVPSTATAPVPTVTDRDEILRYLERLLLEEPGTRIIVLQGEAAGSALSLAPAWAPVAIDPAALRDAAEQAVRHYHQPERLTDNALAHGTNAGERAQHLRALVDDAVDHAFGSNYADIVLREVLTAGYLDPSAQHERAALDLHMSRSTYFRKLRTAVARVVDQLERTSVAQPASALASFPRERMSSLS